MLSHLKIFLSCFLLFVFSISSAKIDSLVVLCPVEISSPRTEKLAGAKTIHADSSNHRVNTFNTLSVFFQNNNSLFVKSYGPGALSTAVFRGGSPNHTIVLWNGFNINSPMNGQADLSLIPVFLFDKISLQYGSSCASWGSGAASGAIQLANSNEFNNGIQIKLGTSIGSFDSYQQNGSISIGKKKSTFRIAFFARRAKNDFKFLDYTQPDGLGRLQNSNTKQHGLVSEGFFKLKSNQQLSFSLWYQENDRNIPPTISQKKSTATQIDQNLRSNINWSITKEKVKYFFRSAYLRDYLIYKDISFDVQDTSLSESFVNELESQFFLGKNQYFIIGVHQSYIKTTSSIYNRNQHKEALFASYTKKLFDNKFSFSASARQEMVDGKKIPFTSSLGVDYQLSSALLIKSNIAKAYRIPTLNDLYWTPGGNPNLKSEHGYSSEMSVVLNKKNKNYSLEVQATVFHKIMKNWITWIPDQFYWSPKNKLMVWSRGIETNSKYEFNYKKMLIGFKLLTNYTVSTNEKSILESDASIGKQLIYTPMYTGNGSIDITFKGYSLSLQQVYVGYRYTSSDHKEFLEPYHLHNICISKTIFLNNYFLDLFFSVNNLFDKNYQITSDRPMPLRNYQFGIQFSFHKHKNKIK